MACNRSSDGHDLAGHPLYLDNYLGKPVLIHYWASWCPPCVKEIPLLNDLYQHYGSKFTLLGVNYDHLSPQALKKEIKKWDIQFPQVTDLTLPMKNKPIVVLPTSIILNPSGKLTTILTGPQNKTTFLHNLFSNELDQKK